MFCENILYFEKMTVTVLFKYISVNSITYYYFNNDNVVHLFTVERQKNEI